MLASKGSLSVKERKVAWGQWVPTAKGRCKTTREYGIKTLPHAREWERMAPLLGGGVGATYFKKRTKYPFERKG